MFLDIFESRPVKNQHIAKESQKWSLNTFLKIVVAAILIHNMIHLAYHMNQSAGQNKEYINQSISINNKLGKNNSHISNCQQSMKNTFDLRKDKCCSIILELFL